MKKILLSVFVLGFGLFAYTQAYAPTDTDTKQLSNLQTALSSANNADLWNYYQQFAKLQKAVEGHDTRLSYLLTSLRDWSFTQITNRKNLFIQQTKTAKAEFLETYEGKLLLDDKVASNCIGRYNTLDNLSFVNNFPTALTIAVRYRESTCSYALPKNGDGPFQIVSKDYGTGEITEELFLQTVQDFLDFSNTKINRYNEKNKADWLTIGLGYTGATQTDLLRFSALYNGLSGATVYGKITPASPKYFREGYENDVWTGTHKKDGIFAEYLKIIKWELGN